MRRKFSLLLIVMLSMFLIVTPALAKGGNSGGGNGGGNSGGNISGGSHASSQASSIEKSDNAKTEITKGNSDKSKNAEKVKNKFENSEKTSNAKLDSNVNPKAAGQNNKQGSVKQSKSKVLEGMSEKQINTVKEKLTQKRTQVQKKTFKDTSMHWAQKNIARVQSLGLISGYQDGSFQPESPVTCAEAMVMAVNLAETLGTDQLIQEDINTEAPAEQDTTPVENTTGEVVSGDPTNTDVPKWAESKAKVASQLRIVNMNRFHSTVQASRAQTAVMLAKALNLDPVDTTEVSFSDSVLISSEDLGYILALKEAGIIFGSPDGKFNPNKNVTRAEIAAMLDRTIDTVEGGEEASEESTESE